MTITLPPELELALTEEARRNGTYPELLAVDELSRKFLPADSRSPLNSQTSVVPLADLLGDFIGCLDSSEFVPGGAQMSENISEKFADGMMVKRRNGKL